MQPRNALVTIHNIKKVPVEMSCDGNTPIYRTTDEQQIVPAKVWPVAMGADEMLVEYEDGCLGAVKLQDIRMGVRATETPEIATEITSTVN